MAIFDGCADRDEDGIPDPKDLCPNERGLLENDGCPLLDRDCDGIVDILDACPDIPDTIGFTGCPDLDQDGIIDSLDQCPEIPGPDSTNGCPEIAKEDKLLLDVAMREVRFRTGSAEILNTSTEILDKVVDIMQRYPSYKLTMDGYTDNVGRASSNQSLSERRAKACYQYLIDQGIATERMHYQGFGEANPIGNNKTRAGREMNRRVEFHLDLVRVGEGEG
ncbi:MAG: OmpA family protein [Bacteroidota bacterium]